MSIAPQTNVLIVFVLGKTAIQGYITLRIQGGFAQSVLSEVASSFPSAGKLFWSMNLTLQGAYDAPLLVK